jgi:hypothetical protein
MSPDLTKLNTASFNLLAFLDYCREEKQLNKNIDKIYEIVVYAFIETLQKYFKIQAMAKLDCETKKLLKDFGLIQNFFLSLDKTSPLFAPIDFRLSKTSRKNGVPKEWPNLGTAIKIKYITLDKHTAPANTYNVTNETMIIVCKDSEKAIIKNFIIQFGLIERIRGFISDHTLTEWYHKCTSPKYVNSIGKTVIEALNKKFKKEFSLTRLSPAMTLS